MKVTNNIGLDLKAIQVDDYWVIVDKNAIINSGDYIYHNLLKGGCVITSKYSNPNTTAKKIIASTKFIDKSIPVIKFVEQSVEELARDSYNQNKLQADSPIESGTYKCGFIRGYNQVKSSDKKYTLADMEAAACFGKILEKFKDDEFKLSDNEEWKGFLESLNQPKLPDIIHLEFEEISDIADEWQISDKTMAMMNNRPLYKLKTITTEQGEEIHINI